ncbi:hypothetical protein FRB96_005597 [Tulasnella sp. 330]|nr:hypothetical protein FRB96_005597 [Tulasnella sp. 330]KAG8886355.1 hypothetical protein FRB97_004890 [Tulasnella sp. 331]KAG8890774.1 hypothetical protein FRB98_004819 [Tulasnella sp. 332]
MDSPVDSMRRRHMARVIRPRQDDPFDIQDNGNGDAVAGTDNGDDALSQLLSSQAAQFSATAFATPTPTIIPNPVPTDTDGVTDPTTDTSLATSTDVTLPTSTTAAELETTSSDTSLPTSTTASVASNISSIPSVTSSSTASTANITSTPAAASSSTKSTSHSAVIGVTITLLILLSCAVAFILIRKRHISQRKSRRATWNPPMYQNTLNTRPGSPSNDSDAGGAAGREFENIDINEKQGAQALPSEVTYQTLSAAPVTYAMPAAPPPLNPTGYAPPRMPSPPPISRSAYDNAGGQPSPVGIDTPTFTGSSHTLVSATQFAPSVFGPLTVVNRGSLTSSNTSSNAATAPISAVTGALVTVVRTFVPSLPDELSIQTGEQVRIVNRYDDGWAHVERMRSGAGVESGVVPLECLQSHVPAPRGLTPQLLGEQPGMGLTQVAVENWRLSKRGSSLRGQDSPIQV